MLRLAWLSAAKFRFTLAAVGLTLLIAMGASNADAANTSTNLGTCDASDLAAAISTANTNAASDPTSTATITLLPGCTYSISSQLSIQSTITIIGNNDTIDGNNSSRIFDIQPGTPSAPHGNLSLRQVNLTRGNPGTIDFGGAVRVQFGPDAGVFAMTGGSITNSTTFAGGALGSITGQMTVDQVTFENDSAVIGGGAIFSVSVLRVTRSTFDNNAADEGSAIYDASPTTTVIANSTFNSNQPLASTPQSQQTVPGSTIYSTNKTTSEVPAETSLTNDTIAGNAVSGLKTGESNGKITVKNTIVSDNTFANCASDSVGATIVDNGNNLRSANVLDTCPTIPVGNPNLGALGDNGGPTATMALLPGSQAIDTADNAACAADPVNNIDERGLPRPVGILGPPICDIGAFEVQASPTPQASAPSAGVLGTITTAGTARAHRLGCFIGSKLVRISGREISELVLSVAGKHLRTVKVTPSAATRTLTVRVNLARVTSGGHLTVLVRFAPGSGSAKTLSLALNRCKVHHQRPRFTG